MTQKDKVMNLFRFMMDLLEEETPETKSDPKAIKETVKTQLTNPTLPYHPVLNPYVDDLNATKHKSPFSDPNSLFSKLADIDKRNADELGKLRAVKSATTPLIDEINTLRERGHNNALKYKEEEELELLGDDIKSRMGVTIENGVTKIIEVPATLRDNIPLSDSNESIVGYTINDKTDELRGFNDLPKEIREKIESNVSENDPVNEPIDDTIKKTKVTTKNKNKNNKSK
jgi:hypothetical protein